MKKIIKLFESGNVCVSGLRGRGKDMLMSNVAIRRKSPYVSNVDYGGHYFPLHMQDFDCGMNTYNNFITGNLKPYFFPYPDGTDIYISDVGVYFPAQYCKQLNKDYGYFSTFMALSRHLGACNVHINVQNLNRAWDKIREQSDIYICCNWTRVLFGKLVIQKVTLYEKYESAEARVPPYKPPRVSLNNDRRLQVLMEKQRYRITHGEIKPRILIYSNRSCYNTRVFKSMLEKWDDESDPKAPEL